MKLTPHFSLEEFGLPAELQTDLNVYKAWRLALLLEPSRTALGVPFRITSGYRSPEHNKRVGGAKNSDHLWTGKKAAVDVVISATPVRRWMAAVQIADNEDYGQLIWYLDTNHIHVSLPTPKHHRELLIAYRTASGERKYELHPRKKWSYRIRELDTRLLLT